MTGRKGGCNSKFHNNCSIFGIFLNKRWFQNVFSKQNIKRQDILSMNVWGFFQKKVMSLIKIFYQKNIQTGLARRIFYNCEKNLNEFKFCQESLHSLHLT